MDSFGRAAVAGFCWGFAWGIGCSLAILYSIYLAGYRKAAKDSLKKVKPQRYTQMLEKILAQKAEKLDAKKAKAAAKIAAPPQ
jgi:hypothetical protein